MKRTIFLLFIIIVSILFVINNTKAILTQPGDLPQDDLLGTGQTQAGGTGQTPVGVQLPNPLGDPTGDPAKVANTIIKYILGLTGVLAIIAFVWGGIEWMISGGAPERIKKGKTMIVWAVLGLVVIFGSYAILDVVFKALGV